MKIIIKKINKAVTEDKELSNRANKSYMNMKENLSEKK